MPTQPICSRQGAISLRRPPVRPDCCNCPSRLGLRQEASRPAGSRSGIRIGSNPWPIAARFLTITRTSPCKWPTGRRSPRKSRSRSSTAGLGDSDAVARALQGFAIVCVMRERTPFPRALIEKLPDLKLLVTTGARNASIDVAAAKERSIVVCGTERLRPSDRRTRGRADDRPCAQDQLRECAHAGRRSLADDRRDRSVRQDARHSRPGQARQPRRQGRPGLRHEGDRLEPELDRRKNAGRPASNMRPRKSC